MNFESVTMNLKSKNNSLAQKLQYLDVGISLRNIGFELSIAPIFLPICNIYLFKNMLKYMTHIKTPIFSHIDFELPCVE